ncbi:MAG: hypothetical protein NTW06_03665 [Candidatus Falkowbacteria bacterium]|nr:hypothetical protein [Candidatus Falkowbacteria bacterium]
MVKILFAIMCPIVFFTTWHPNRNLKAAIYALLICCSVEAIIIWWIMPDLQTMMNLELYQERWIVSATTFCVTIGSICVGGWLDS